MRPLQETGALGRIGFALVFDHCAIWKFVYKRFMPCKALRVKLAIKVIDLAFSQESSCLSAAAEKTRSMARRQCRDFIKEEERGVAFPHGFMLHVLVVHIAANPVDAGPAALPQSLIITVKLAAAIAHHGAAFRHRHDATVGLNAVLQGHWWEPEW